MRWPLVSRERYDELKLRVAQLEDERASLMLAAYGVRVPQAAAPVVPPPPVRHASEEQEVDQHLGPVAQAHGDPADPRFDTPFDRLGRRFDRAKKSGTNIQQFRARVS
jgi:hypothetical protein